MNRICGFSCLRGLAVVAAFAMMAAAGCGGDTDPVTDAGNDDGPVDVVIPMDFGNDAADDVRIDTNEVAAGDVEIDSTPPDVPVELPPDLEPPYVIGTYPADEETDVPMDFVVRITFNEPMRPITLSGNFIKLYDINDQEVPGDLAYDAVSNTVAFTPDPETDIYKLAPYRIWISSEIQDLAANKPDTEMNFRFSTVGPANMDGYLELAAKYSPDLYQSTGTEAQWDYPILANFDGDWVSENNITAYSALTSIPIWVYYDVIETYTHYFIRYHYFYAKHVDTSKTYANEVSGTMVVVQKNPEMPIAVETYFGTSAFEDIRSFVTTESGLVVDNGNGDYNDADRKNYNVNWVFPQDQLFPGNHFQNYLTKGNHESCAWIHTTKEDGMDFRCDLTAAMKPGLSIMHFAYTDGTPGTMTPPFAKSNNEGNDVGYGLRLVVQDWWVRRDRAAVGQLFSSTLKFDAPVGLLGKNMILPGSFRGSPDGSQAGGKSPWRWAWKPSVSGAYNYLKTFTEGTFYVHPAYYFAERHRLSMTADASGFSGVYCYNPYLLVDRRGEGNCSTVE